jgi:heme/copper-type cytochrome/quinol oxidase subunit 2
MIKNPVFLIFCGLSVICGMILWGGSVYSGSVLPSTQGAPPAEARSIWIHWGFIVAIPAMTIIWLLVGLITDRRR